MTMMNWKEQYLAQVERSVLEKKILIPKLEREYPAQAKRSVLEKKIQIPKLKKAKKPHNFRRPYQLA